MPAVRPAFQRMGACLASVWLGGLLCLATLATPAAFAVLTRDQAGLLVARLFAQEAALSMALAVLFVMALRRWADTERMGSDSRVWATLGVLLCTVVGYYALQPMMAAARAGQGSLSFGALHGLSTVFFGLKTLLVGWLAWRLSR